MTQWDIIQDSMSRKTRQSPKAEAFTQMCLDYLSAPATSVDAEWLFSFSGGTIMKLCNQLSEKSAYSTVMVGQWASDLDLIAVDEFKSHSPFEVFLGALDLSHQILGLE
ncbi:hypothetical protein DFH08DRAFT_797409 [Mycena albidolilacea]|uniref:Uncharacterized protein n=1 Tax=Mycena albidolilacea TaxID=1033008 RepID=A0AAD7F4Y3_9AGAR|nr:hypothetical protein DFH08DRAFT_797409 [Mycena albidolilacea]